MRDQSDLAPPAVTIGHVQNQPGLLSASRRVVALIALSLAAAAHTRIAHAGADGPVGSENRLRVRVVGLRNDNGDVRCSLYSSAQDFPTNDDLRATTVTAPIADQSATCEFSTITAGTYAIVVFHDENADGKFNRNWLGMPKEGYGFSNDAPARWHPPKFGAASFPFTDGTLEILVHIRY
jgi:uncharacterized protein (DUF2141 family)